MTLVAPNAMPRRVHAPASAAAPFASVVVVTRAPSLVLARLLRSLPRTANTGQIELLLGVESHQVAAGQRLVDRFVPWAPSTVVGLNGGSPGERRNVVSAAARGEIVLFLDDDVEVRSDLFTALALTFADEDVIVAGGPNLTPPAAPRFEQVAGRVLASPLGSGPVRHRYAIGSARPGRSRSLTLCNLAIRRRLVELEPFTPELLCAEENELLGRMAGGSIVHTPSLAVYHHRRSSFRLHGRQLFKYGVGRGQVVARHPSLRQVAFLAPALAAGCAAALLAVAPVAGGALVALYALAVGTESMRVAGLRDAPLAALIMVLTHAGYAAGTVSGLVYELAQRR